MQDISFLGGPVEKLETPALVVDIEQLQANLKLLAGYFSTRKAKLRPHFKSHKCVKLARLQMEAGGIEGITCAKISEAQVLVDGGIGDVLIANQILSIEKLRRLCGLNRRALVRVTVDSSEGIERCGKVASEAGVTVGVLLEVEIGMNRCGVFPGDEAVKMAVTISRTPGLRFDGLQGYEGHLVLIRDPEERRSEVLRSMELLLETRKAIEQAGLEVAIVSGGGTGTYDVTGNLEWVDEIQCGSYALMDSLYKTIRPEFFNARYALGTVISSRSGKAVVDMGAKQLGCEFGPPELPDHQGAKVPYVAEEHLPVEGIDAKPGERIRLIPSHGCTTNNLHRKMWVVRDGIVEDLWQLEGAGCIE